MDRFPLTFRKIGVDDFDLIKPLLSEVISTKQYFALSPDADEQAMKSYWMKQDVWIALYDDKVVGSYYLHPNHIGHGSHIANGAYMVASKFSGHGIGRKLGEHSIIRANELGYLAMQFNLVVSNNYIALHLWRSLGFIIIGTIREAYHYKAESYVDAHIMYKKLDHNR